MKAEFGNLEQIKMLQKEQRDKELAVEAKKRRRYNDPLEEYIDTEADLGWHYWCISETSKRLDEKSNLSPIETLIDRAVGNRGNAEFAETITLVLKRLYAIKRIKTKLNKKFDRYYSIDEDLISITDIKKLLKNLK